MFLCGTGEITQWEKVPSARTYTVEGENRFLQVVLCFHTCALTVSPLIK